VEEGVNGKKNRGRRRKKRVACMLLPPVKRKRMGAREKKQRRRGKVISQGLMRNFRKLQGLICKEKFPVDLKPQ
jgi:hypothetical protein